MMKVWNLISLAGVSDDMRFDAKRRIILLNRTSVTLFLIVFTLRTLVLTFGLQQFTPHALLPFLAITLILVIPYINYLGYYKYNAFIFCLITPVSFLFFSVMSQTVGVAVNINHYYLPRIFILGALVLPLILIDPKNRILLYIAILINFICILSFDRVVDLVGVPFNPNIISFNQYEIISKIMILPALLMVIAFLFLTNLNRKYEKQIVGLNETLINKNRDLEQYNREIEAQRDIISIKNKELEQSNEEVTSQRDLIAYKNELLEKTYTKIEWVNKELTDSILYAEKIQRAVLFEQQLPKKYFNDSFIFFKPKSHVSGDFYYYKESYIKNENCIVVAAVDCTGHGVPGGFLSMLGITLINEILQNDVIKDAAEILNLLRYRIKRTLNQKGAFAEQKDGMEMALCIYYPKTKKMEYAGARTPLCYIDAQGEFRVIKGDRQPIGVHLKEKEFTNHIVQFAGNEMVYLFSDGFQDQFSGSDGEKIKFKEIKKLLSKIAANSCENQKNEIEEFLNKWRHKADNTEQEQIDDIVFIGMRI